MSSSDDHVPSAFSAAAGAPGTGGSSRPLRVLFVCMGNICRSPAAEAVLRRMVAEHGLEERVEIDSAGTIGYHAGSPPDPRMHEAADRRGYRTGGRARRVTREDFDRFDRVIALDRQNLADLEELIGGPHDHVRLLSSYLPDGQPPDVPDPYYGGRQGFEQVLDLLERACPALLEELVGGSPPESPPEPTGESPGESLDGHHRSG